MAKLTEIDKLFNTYHRAAADLCIERDKQFPVGVQIINSTGYRTTVIGGSLYPDQINTTMGHTSWRTARRIE